MLSRVAERIYWMSRYVERAENTARLVSVNTHLMLDLPKRTTLGWQTLIDITGSKALFEERLSEANERNVVRFLIADATNSGSLLSSLHLARENARTIRDVIPREAWESINTLHSDTKNQLPYGLSRNRRFDYLESIIGKTQQLTGLLAGTMLHDQGYEFLRIGRNLERADMTTRIIDVRSNNLLLDEPEELVPYQHVQWMSVLKSLSAYQCYRQKIQGPVRRGDVLKFLIQDSDFPRAFCHCVVELQTALNRLPRQEGPMRAVARLDHIINSVKPADLTDPELHHFIDDLQCHLAKVNDLITTTYFSLTASASPKQKKGSKRGKKQVHARDLASSVLAEKGEEAVVASPNP